MPRTVLDLIQRAHERLNEVGFGQSLTAEQAQLGLNAYNEMTAEWALSGVDTQATETTLATAFPLDMPFFPGVAALLATRLAEDYGHDLVAMPRLVRDAKNGWTALQAAYIAAPNADFEYGLTRAPSQRRYLGQ